MLIRVFQQRLDTFGGVEPPVHDRGLSVSIIGMDENDDL